MATPIKFDPPLVVDLGDNPGSVEFKDVDQLIQWATNERSKWSRVLGGGAQQNTTLGNSVRQQQSQSVEQIISKASQFRNNHPSDAAPAQALQQLIAQIDGDFAVFRDHRAIHADSKHGRMVLAIDDNTLAFYVLAVIQRRLGSVRSGENFEVLPLLQAWQIVHAEEPNRRAESEALQKAAAEAAAKLADATASYNELTKKFEETLAAGRADVDKGKKDLAASLKEMNGTITAAVGDAETMLSARLKAMDDKVKEIETFYERQMAIQRPVLFWRAKAASHENNSWRWGIGFLVVLALSIVWLEVWGVDAAKEVLTAGQVNLAPIAKVTLPFFFIIWLLRMCSRMFTLNVGLMWDAKERASMAMTFISLLRQKDGLKDAERAEVIKSLFRPAAVTSADDSAPPGVIEALINKAVTR